MNILQQIVNSIGKTLNSLFPDIPILDNTLEQEITPPAFFIRKISSTVYERRANRLNLDATFEVVYEPNSDFPESECFEVEMLLLEHLRYIDDSEGGYGFRGELESSRVVAGILHYTLRFRESLYLEQERPPKIESIKIDENRR